MYSYRTPAWSSDRRTPLTFVFQAMPTTTTGCSATAARIRATTSLWYPDIFAAAASVTGGLDRSGRISPPRGPSVVTDERRGRSLARIGDHPEVRLEGLPAARELRA